jgi:hypothetical protein
MTTVAHPPKKGYRTIRLPLAESEYDQFLTDRSYAQARLDELYEDFGSLVFPGVSDYCIVNELYQHLDRSPS